MEIFWRYLAVGSGGFLGTIARYGLGTFIGRFRGFPLGTYIINITGSFILGWFAQLALRKSLHPLLVPAIGVGFVGGYTTFSTFMFESNALLKDGAWYLAALNLFGSLLVGLAAVRLGIVVADRM